REPGVALPGEAVQVRVDDRGTPVVGPCPGPARCEHHRRGGGLEEMASSHGVGLPDERCSSPRTTGRERRRGCVLWGLSCHGVTLPPPGVAPVAFRTSGPSLPDGRAAGTGADPN